MSLNKNLGLLLGAVFVSVAVYGGARIYADSILSTVEAETMTLPASGSSVVGDASASGGQTVRMIANGDVTKSFDTGTQSDYFKFRVKGVTCRGNWPRLMVYLDNTRVYNSLVSSTQLSEVQITRTTLPGNHTLRYNFSNAASNSTCYRTLYLDVANFYAVAPPAPTLNLVSASNSIPYASGTTLSWTSTNADSCEAGGDWLGTQTVSGTYDTGSLVASKSYSLTCIGAGGTEAKTVSVEVSPPPLPNISFNAVPNIIYIGESSSLEWNVDDADSCEASGDWSGTVGVSGSQIVGPLSDVGTLTYSLSCSGIGGTSIASVVVDVQTPPPPPLPVVNITATPNPVVIGQTTTISWTSDNADSCEASGDWIGAQPVSGELLSGELTAESTYTLSCSGPGGEASSTVVVSVLEHPVPNLTLTADATNLEYDTGTTLRWVSSDADNCESSGSWSGSQPLVGSFDTGALTQNQTYTLSCTGPGGVVEKSVELAVASAPLPCSIDNTAGCVAGTTILLENSGWTCSQALTNYGTLPIKVVVNATQPYGAPGVTLTTGCAGDADPNSIDLILDVKGNGLSYGPGQDAVKIKLQAGYNNGIQITGHGDCGPRTSSDGHQDGVQAQGGRNISFVDFSIGDYDSGYTTCQGAGGAMFYSSAGGYSATNMHVIRGKYIGCVKGLSSGGSGNSGSVTNALFRSGRTNSDPVCAGYNAPRTCVSNTNVPWTNVSCQKWNSSLNSFVEGSF